MEEVDKILEFLFENTEDDRVSIWKKMKYGFRHYYISLYIDSPPDENGKVSRNFGQYSTRLLITIDNRNNCVEMEYEDNNIVIEGPEMVGKWTNRFEDYINNSIKEDINIMLETALSDCYRKDLHREYKMKKIFKDDEPI